MAWLPTYPTSMVVFRPSLGGAISNARFHCSELETVLVGSYPPDGDAAPPRIFVGGVSSVRVKVLLTENGALLASTYAGVVRSRWKNCPKPARSAMLPLPVGSHEIPIRGANR